MNSELITIRGPITYIKEAWGIYSKKENFIFFARVMAVLVIITTLISVMIGYFFPSDYVQNGDFSNLPLLVGYILLSIVMGLVGLWTQTTTYYAILKMGNPEKEIFQLGYKKMWRYFLISLVVGLIVLGGAILLVIPGILFSIWYSFSTLLTLDKNMGVRDALKTSKQLVSGKFWRVLGRFIVFGIFVFVVTIFLTIIPLVGPIALSFVSPLFTLPFYLLYKDLLLEK